VLAKNLILGALLPFLIALAQSLMPPARSRVYGGAASWRYGAALTLGYAAAHLALMGLPLPPRDALGWVFYGTLAAMLLFLLEKPMAATAGWLFIARSGVALILAWRLLGPTIHYVWGTWASLVRVAVLGAAMMVVWGSLERPAARVSGVSASLATGLLAAGLSATLLLSHSIRLAQMAGALAASSGGVLVAALLRPGPSGWGMASVAAFPMTLLAAAGFFYSDTPWPCLLLLILAPLPFALWWREEGASRAWMPLGASALLLALSALTAGLR